jgi:hypothetical protein
MTTSQERQDLVEERIKQQYKHVPSHISDLMWVFSINLVRVDSLVSAAKSIRRDADSEDASDDILRSAVVLLHATLEDLLRRIGARRLPSAEAEFLATVPLFGDRSIRANKFTLAEISSHRALSIDDLVQKSIEQWLSQKSFNDVNDVISMRKSMGLRNDHAKPFLPDLQEMIKRRHAIVHNADLINKYTTGITPETVEKWAENMTDFGAEMISELSYQENQSGGTGAVGGTGVDANAET